MSLSLSFSSSLSGVCVCMCACVRVCVRACIRACVWEWFAFNIHTTPTVPSLLLFSHRNVNW